MIITIICITILAYFIGGKDTEKQLDKLKDVDWKAKANDVFGKIGNYAKRQVVWPPSPSCNSIMC